MKIEKQLPAFLPIDEFEKKIFLLVIVIRQSRQKTITNRNDVIAQTFLTFWREEVCWECTEMSLIAKTCWGIVRELSHAKF